MIRQILIIWNKWKDVRIFETYEQRAEYIQDQARMRKWKARI